MLLLLGAAFTRVWSRRHRPEGVQPEAGAERKERDRRDPREVPAAV